MWASEVVSSFRDFKFCVHYSFCLWMLHCPSHLIILDLTTQIISGEEHLIMHFFYFLSLSVIQNNIVLNASF
jgi:hypothetical protein